MLCVGVAAEASWSWILCSRLIISSRSRSMSSTLSLGTILNSQTRRTDKMMTII